MFRAGVRVNSIFGCRLPRGPDRLLACVPYRQWVLVVPKRLRYFINHNPALAGELSKVFAREINRFLCGNNAGTPAQLHFIQRFGGSLNLHIHVHAVVSDGVFSLKTNALGKKELAFTPGAAELFKIPGNRPGFCVIDKLEGGGAFSEKLSGKGQNEIRKRANDSRLYVSYK